MFTKYLTFVFFLLFLSSTVAAQDIEDYRSFEYYQPFRQLECGLWINSNGDIAYKSMAMAPPTFDEATGHRLDSFDVVDYYISNTYDAQASDTTTYQTNLRDIVDTLTFEILDSIFYFKDKNRVYFHIPMAYGGHWSVGYSVDVNSFKVLDDSHYACDKNNCYVFSRDIEGADPATFRVLDGEYSISRDKNNFYQFTDVMTEDDIKEYEAENNVVLSEL